MRTAAKPAAIRGEAGAAVDRQRGYSNPEDVAHVKDAGGEVLLRYNRGALPSYDVKGQLIDVMGRVQSLGQPWEMAEWAVWVQPKGREPVRAACARCVCPRRKRNRLANGCDASTAPT